MQQESQPDELELNVIHSDAATESSPKKDSGCSLESLTEINN